MSLDGGGSQTHSRQCSGIQSQELWGTAMRQGLWAGRRVGSIHGSQGAAGASASSSLSSLSDSLPVPPTGKVSQEAESEQIHGNRL